MTDRKRMTVEEYEQHKAKVLGMVCEEPRLMLVDEFVVADHEIEKAIEILIIERILRGE